ncbi:MAG: hypothetical protein ABJM06_03790 [Gilvibacter sp.]
MQKLIVLALIATVLFTSCETEKDPFLISKGSIGLLSKDHKVNQLDSIYTLDSVVFTQPDPENFVRGNEVEIYDSEGKLLLILDPENANDRSSTVVNIQVIDARFLTDKGLGVNSTYKAIKDNYEIEAIESTLSSVVVFIKDSDIYVTIDKQDLPENLRYTQSKIESTQIPDEATFKYFMMGWDQVEEESDSDSDAE